MWANTVQKERRVETMTRTGKRFGIVVFSLAAAVIVSAAATPAWSKVELKFPLVRTAYQTNEDIHLAVVRSAPQALAAGDLVVTLAGDDASRMSFTLAVPAAAPSGGEARATEHVYLAGRLLRPGRYAVEVAVDGETAKAEIELYSHVRRSTYKLISWGSAKGKQLLAEGEDSLGFNLYYGHDAVANLKDANLLRAGVDFMLVCTMGGAHQMDMRGECDWSDPYVIRGGTVRVARQAFADRTQGNCIGVHDYDEPGLTWGKDPATGKSTAHAVPSQHRSYESAFGQKPIDYKAVDPKNPADAARWRQWAYWKLAFMDAAWKHSQFGVNAVRPDFISATQSQYGWTAFTDGYYFNVARCLPVASGHGGYHDYGLIQFNPSFFLEFARARDWAKPCWYLPCWYGSTTSDQFRLEQYLSFQTGIQGLITPPDIDPFEPARKPAADGVVESNKLAARLGTIFTTMPVTRPPAAVLYSMSHLIHVQTQDRTMNYAHADKHAKMLNYVYLASKIIQQQFLPVLDEDVVDGTLAANHKAVILADIDYLDPAVATGLENFVADGGLVLLAGKCQVKIKGAIDLGVRPTLPDQDIVDKLEKEQKWQERAPYVTLGRQLQAVKPLADAIKSRLEKAGIAPIFACDDTGIVATRQAAGDIEYLFAVNAAADWKGPNLNVQAAAVTIGLVDDGRPIYDAVLGGKMAQFEKKGGKQQAALRFGPGQMRVFARTARPISGVEVATPVIRRDYTVAQEPLSVEIGAMLLAEDGGAVSGSAPLRVRLTDPLGEVRYDLYRATALGSLRLALPLAINDPAGKWTVTVTDLLANTESSAAFNLPAVPRCGAVAGRKERAIHFGQDRDNIYRFFREFRSVTIATGKSDYNQAAAERLATILGPWDVKATIVKADAIAKPRQLPAEAVATWVGLEPGRVDAAKPAVQQVGFAVEGPVILLGTPEDNPVIAFLAKQRFLPYVPSAGEVPGRGRGMIAWQRDGVGHEQESITLIAYDAEGMAEAVGTLYEAMAGLEPLTPLVPPTANQVAAATKADRLPEPKLVWQAVLPDRAVAMTADGARLTVLTRDESISVLDAKGKAGSPQALKPDAYEKKLGEMNPAAAAAFAATKPNARPAPVKPDPEVAKVEKASPLPGRIVKYVAPRGDWVAVGYWGGLLRILGADGKPAMARQFQHDITGLAWVGDTLAVGLSDGRVIGLSVK
jgi:hypothetical protein